jgi:hypothetical protein
VKLYREAYVCPTSNYYVWGVGDVGYALRTLRYIWLRYNRLKASEYGYPTVHHLQPGSTVEACCDWMAVGTYTSL